MRSFSWRPIVTVLMCVACLPASAGLLEDFQKVTGEGKVSMLADIDNDTLLFKKDDRFYTSGMRVTRQHVLRDGDVATVFGWRIGQEQYTPSDIKLPPAQIAPNDHPYAGWLYGGVFKETYRSDGSYLKTGVDLGCIGPCAGGEWVQTKLHRLINQPLPQGWSRQVRNEFGVVLHADVAPIRWSPRSWADLTPNLHARFGNIFSDAGAGLSVRVGRLNGLPDQPAIYGFMRVDGRAVAYNATLQGGYFSDSNPHTVRPKRVVGEAEIGMVWSRPDYAVRASLVRRGNEIDGLSNATGAQNFLSLQFSYTP